jgi:hypothetical protein
MCVDAMPLVRSQLEKLFGICLMVEDASALDDYLKNEWKLLYIRDLLMRAGCQDLPKVMHVLEGATLERAVSYPPSCIHPSSGHGYTQLRSYSSW